jgi:GPH family glycoside/pentoside/hexuronide:cation symporter
MAEPGNQKLSFLEKSGYSAGDAAANFVFMTMVLFQTNFYTDIFGLSAAAAAAILLWPRLWDAVADPIVGILADRTETRWGKFRPWILFTAVPWFIVMILAYTTPHGWSMAAMITYAVITNTLLMTIYSMNNMPYAALGGVMTGDVNERTKLNSFRFVAVNAAQFIVGGFTLTLVAKFAAKHAAGATVGLADKQYGWQMTMTVWAVLCLVLFLITFATTKERIKPIQQVPIMDAPAAKKEKSRWALITIAVLVVSGLACWASVRYGTSFLTKFTGNNYVIQTALWIWRIFFAAIFLLSLWRSLSASIQKDFSDLAKNNPWKVMWCWTLVHFAILSFRGGALYNYYHHYADKTAMFDFVQKLGLVAAPGAQTSGLMETLGLVVHGDVASLANSNVADVFNSFINMLGTGLTIIAILLSPPLAKKFGKKAVAATGFGLATVGSLAFYLLSPTNTWGMFAITAFVSIAYAPTIPLTWAIFADVADYSELKTGRRFTGMVFATIGFALKSGLALGSASFLWIMAGIFHYDTHLPDAPDAIRGFRVCSGIVVGILFGICTVLLASYQLNKSATIQMADELAERRRKVTV